MTTPISFVGLRQQYAELKEQIDAAIASVVERSAFIGGPEVAAFERWFAGYCGARHGLGVASGTTALELTIRALGIGDGDEVVIPAHTFIATASAISVTGARPILVDVDERTFTLDPDRLDASISPRTKAIVPVHLYGRPAALDEILAIAGRHGVPVVEDAAQAHGACYRGRRVGSIGVAACFSFYPTKNLGAFGDAGLVTTNDDALAERIALLRDHGRVSKYEHGIVGYTARLDNLQAAVLRVQAEKLDEWNARRREVACWYRRALPASLALQDDDAAAPSVYHVFPALVLRRDAFRRFLESRGIPTAVHYPIPLHLQPAYRYLGYSEGQFPVSERVAREVVSLPMHPFLRQPDVERVAAVAAEFLHTL